MTNTMLPAAVNALVVGYGYWGKKLARVIEGSPHLRLVAIADSCAEAITAAAADFPGTICVPHAAAIAGRNPVKLAFVATPPTSQFAIAQELLSIGIHTAVEKPFTASARHARQLLSHASSSRLQLSVDFTYMFAGGIRAVRKLLSKGTIGRVNAAHFVRTNATDRIPAAVNVAHDLLCHDLSIIFALFQTLPTAVRADRVVFNSTAVSAMKVEAEYLTGMTSVHELDWRGPSRTRFLEIVGTLGRIRLDQNSGELTVEKHEGGFTHIVASRREPLRRYVDWQARRLRRERCYDDVLLAINLLEITSDVIYSAVSGGGWIQS